MDYYILLVTKEAAEPSCAVCSVTHFHVLSTLALGKLSQPIGPFAAQLTELNSKWHLKATAFDS